jgi:DNA-binding NarL/FixJ family response regulator
MRSTTTDSPNGHGMSFLLADEHALVPEGLKHLNWQKSPGVSYIEFSNAISLLRAAGAAPGANLALIDASMPGMGQGYGLGQVARLLPGVPIVVVSSMEDPKTVRYARTVPTVHAFVTKNSTAQQLHIAIDAALTGHRLNLAVPPRPSLQPRTGFTPRMVEVHALLRQGMGNRAIAAALSLSEGTVKNYMSEIFRTLGVVNRTQAAGCEAWPATMAPWAPSREFSGPASP